MTEMPEFPPPCRRVCRDCPWARVATPGWLGPMEPEEWTALAHSDAPIACHETIRDAVDGEGDWSHPRIRQCRGAAIFRGNVMKSPRHPDIVALPADRELVFANDREFLDHHDPERTDAARWHADIRRKG